MKLFLNHLQVFVRKAVYKIRVALKKSQIESTRRDLKNIEREINENKETEVWLHRHLDDLLREQHNLSEDDLQLIANPVRKIIELESGKWYQHTGNGCPLSDIATLITSQLSDGSLCSGPASDFVWSGEHEFRPKRFCKFPPP